MDQVLEWESFFVAEVGAAAVFAGLIFVGLSINLEKILSFKRLPNRAAQALALLMMALLAGSFVLMPGLPDALRGGILFVVGAGFWLFITVLDYIIWGESDAQYRKAIPILAAINQLCLLPYLVGGALIAMSNAMGLYLLAFAMLLSFGKAMLDAWVLLVEINR